MNENVLTLNNVLLTVKKADIYRMISRNSSEKTMITKLITALSQEAFGGEFALLGKWKGIHNFSIIFRGLRN
ncbi:hypothetical protein BAU15_10640 [Enterococcus sp. JM4C]|uniref:hypothetical protein n=1 Tax=Candidatus Enterococcus huntleyi TaxID=1857217 RepID=UPI00137B46E6|nr:hypothetical protein [Enterococcus sp. JM4C]KAF1296233.1 hypothetical protein BAU15_10640 [Enterococcus sp. JM4C]